MNKSFLISMLAAALVLAGVSLGLADAGHEPAKKPPATGEKASETESGHGGLGGHMQEITPATKAMAEKATSPAPMMAPQPDGHGGHMAEMVPAPRPAAVFSAAAVAGNLTRMPPSGAAREAGFDNAYGMEPTSAGNPFAAKCAQGTRGIVMLDNEEWERCGGRPAGAPATPEFPAAPHWYAPEEAAGRPNPIPASGESIARGRQLFQTYCVACHGPEGRGDGPAGATLTPKPADLPAMAGMHPDGDFAWKIATGRGPMPSWKAALQENQIWDLVNFIKSLEK